MTDEVRCEVHAGVYQLIIQREQALNAIGFGVMSALEEHLSHIETDASARILLLRSAGSHFSAGGDLRAFSDLKTAADAEEMVLRMRRILERIEALPVISIACVQGDAYGGGFETALAFDQIWLSERARIGFTQARFALTPAWGGFTRLAERVGAEKAMSWLLSQQQVSAEEAEKTGLVECVLAADAYEAEVEKRMKRLLQTDSGVAKALKSLKRQFKMKQREELMALETTFFTRLWASEAHFDQLDAFWKRKESTDQP